MTGLQLVAALLVTLLGGGALGVWLKYRIDSRKIDVDEARATKEQEREDFDTIVALVTKQRDEAWEKVGELQAKFELLEMELHGMRLAGDLDPFPNWITDLEGRYIFVNREFEKQFLEPQGKGYRDVIGKGHEHLWADAFCKKLKQLDAQARARADGHARAKTMLDGRQVTVHKFPVRVKAIPVAYAGYITNIEEIIETPAE